MGGYASVLAMLMLTLCLSPPAFADPLPRSAAEVMAFKRENPCPATGLRRGACPGWDVDHIRPLCMGGPETKENMQWLSKEGHRFKTRVDVRECRKWKKMASTPAK
jgi:hypothetical protein